jgi:hypothetical protein
MKIENDDQLDAAIARVDELLKYVGTNENGADMSTLTQEQAEELEELSDAIEEYEDWTDILNRDYRI